jgi:heme/copper-type cytochrome/quinol oxidase subunit 2
MSLSTPGLIGAGAGVLFALVIYIIMSAAWRRNIQDPKASVEQRDRFERMWPTVRIMLTANFAILGWLGYTAGDVLGN